MRKGNNTEERVDFEVKGKILLWIPLLEATLVVWHNILFALILKMFQLPWQLESMWKTYRNSLIKVNKM